MAKEYIERDALIEDFKSCGAVKELIDAIIFRIYMNPTADVAEVKHGRWIEKPFLLGTSNFCSLCDGFYGMPHGKFTYCHNCGAKMDLK